jgi:hypothetical protein
VTPRTLAACARVLDRCSQSSSSAPSREPMPTHPSSRVRTLARARPRAALHPPNTGARASRARTPASSRCSSALRATSSRASDVDASRPQRYGTATTYASASSARAKGRPRVDVAIALRTSEGIVRKAASRAAARRERGRELVLERHTSPDELVAAGMSVRAAAAATGVPRSTLAGRLARAANTN